MQKGYLVITALMSVMLWLSSCIGGTVTCGVSVKLLNASESEVIDLRLLFMDQVVKKLYAGQEYTLDFSWSGKYPYISDDHIEYRINDKKYDHKNEKGAFAGKPLVINETLLLITIYSDSYTMEMKDLLEYDGIEL
ncbi:MAG: hypothetical protein LBU18_06800 [Treponema sp.]|jgi:hypothetical protein|nr:hypothetical protein [Treponema sp.]